MSSCIVIVRERGRWLPREERRVEVLHVTRTRLVVVRGLDGEPWAFERSSGKASALGGQAGQARRVTWSDWRILWGGASDLVWLDAEAETA